jgi:hypothetical protein
VSYRLIFALLSPHVSLTSLPHDISHGQRCCTLSHVSLTSLPHDISHGQRCCTLSHVSLTSLPHDISHGQRCCAFFPCGFSSLIKSFTCVAYPLASQPTRTAHVSCKAQHHSPPAISQMIDAHVRHLTSLLAGAHIYIQWRTVLAMPCKGSKWCAARLDQDF